MFIGLGVSIFYEIYTKIIFSIREMKLISKLPLLCLVSSQKDEPFEDSLQLLLSGTLSNVSGNISFLVVGEIPDNQISLITNYLNKSTSGSKLKISKNIIDAINNPNLVLITSLGITKKDELREITTKLMMQEINVIGLLILDKLNIK